MKVHAYGACAVLLLSGCGQALTASNPAALPWMRADAKNQDLIYATGGCLGTCVFAYPSGALVGTLGIGGNGNDDNSGDCSDTTGNVYIANGNAVVEYAHGATKPTATFNLPGSKATGCSIDPITGDLAAVFVGSAENVAIFPHGTTEPVLFNSGINASYCGYDASGNLFVDGFGSTNAPALTELRSGSGGFVNIAMKDSLGIPGQIQWDGSYITYESLTLGAVDVSRLDVDGSSATVVGTTAFHVKSAFQSWIAAGSIFIPYGNKGIQNRIGVWNYPTGGKPVSRIRPPVSYQKTINFRGVTLSLAPTA